MKWPSLTAMQLALGVVAYVAPITLEASSYCAFEVRVASPSGAPLSSVPVALIRSNKTTFSEAVTSEQGLAKFCDAPLESVSVVVGFDICGSVLVRNLKPTWPATQNIFVTYVKTPCNHLAVGDFCQLLLRIRNEKGEPVAGATFDTKPVDMASMSSSDVLGRLFLSLKRNQPLDGFVTKTPYKPTRVSAECIDDKEIEVMLKDR